MTCDPKLVPEAHRVKTISFAEAAELAYLAPRFFTLRRCCRPSKKISLSWS